MWLPTLQRQRTRRWASSATHSCYSVAERHFRLELPAGWPAELIRPIWSLISWGRWIAVKKKSEPECSDVLTF
jgi:hypothetical protein